MINPDVPRAVRPAVERSTRTVDYRDDAAVRSMWRMDHPLEQAFRLLHATFTLALIIAGVDKFFNVLIDWSQYLAPTIPDLLGVTPQTFMRGIGIGEVIAGVVVGLAPRVGAYVVAAWLWAMIANLFMRGYYFDVALRHLALSLGALALGRLAEARHRALRGIERETTTVVEAVPAEEPTLRRAA